MRFRRNEILPAGSPAPAIEGLTAKGPLLVVFFKITCPVCQFTLPFLNRIHQAGTLPVFGISQNDDADTREFVQEFGIEYPVLLDPEDADFPASNAYGISSVPTLFLIGAGRQNRARRRRLEPQGNGVAGRALRHHGGPAGRERTGMESRLRLAQLGSRAEPVPVTLK